jgi:hypothetical protein
MPSDRSLTKKHSSLSPEQLNHNSVRKAQEFYEELDRLLYRYNPNSYAPAIASMIYSLVDKPEEWRRFPPHKLLNSIEVNCKAHRNYLDDLLTKPKLERIINHYNGYEDPYIEYTLDELKNPMLTFLAMAREQFSLQMKATKYDLTRALMLFTSNNPLPKFSTLFTNHYGFSMGDWIYMCFAVNSLTIDRKPLIVQADNFLSSDLKNLPKKAVIPFLDLSSKSVNEVRNHYLDKRKDLQPYLFIFLPSVFIDFPFLSFENGTYLAPHPNLILNHAISGLYRVSEALNSELFLNEFSKSFERYVKNVLSELPGYSG